MTARTPSSTSRLSSAASRLGEPEGSTIWSLAATALATTGKSSKDYLGVPSGPPLPPAQSAVEAKL